MPAVSRKRVSWVGESAHIHASKSFKPQSGGVVEHLSLPALLQKLLGFCKHKMPLMLLALNAAASLPFSSHCSHFDTHNNSTCVGPGCVGPGCVGPGCTRRAPVLQGCHDFVNWAFLALHTDLLHTDILHTDLIEQYHRTASSRSSGQAAAARRPGRQPPPQGQRRGGVRAVPAGRGAGGAPSAGQELRARVQTLQHARAGAAHGRPAHGEAQGLAGAGRCWLAAQRPARLHSRS